MNEKKWQIEYCNGSWSSRIGRKIQDGKGFYRIKFDGHYYGMISKNAWDEMKTGKILAFVEQMLNDAHSLALREHE